MTAQPHSSSAASRDGAITVTTTEQGLPLAIRMDDTQLRRDPTLLAKDVLRLCKQSAQRAGLRRREQMREAGVATDIIDKFGLPKPEDVAREEIVDDWEGHETSSWMRSV